LTRSICFLNLCLHCSWNAFVFVYIRTCAVIYVSFSLCVALSSSLMPEATELRPSGARPRAYWTSAVVRPKDCYKIMITQGPSTVNRLRYSFQFFSSFSWTSY
jgi:hypothetical protein